MPAVSGRRSPSAAWLQQQSKELGDVLFQEHLVAPSDSQWVKNLYDRAKENGCVDSQALKQAWEQLEKANRHDCQTMRQQVISKLTRAFETTGLQDEWLAHAISLFDRARARAPNRGKPPVDANAAKELSSNMQHELFAAAHIALKHSPVEAEFEVDAADVLMRTIVIPPHKQAKLFAEITHKEFRVLHRLGWQTSVPTSHDIAKWLSIGLCRHAQALESSSNSMADGVAAAQSGGSSSSSSWPGFKRWSHRSLSTPTRAVGAMRPQPRLVLLSGLLVELAVECLPIETVYGGSPGLLAVAALEVALHAFGDVPAVCHEFVAGHRRLLLSEAKPEEQLADLKQSLTNMWLQPPDWSEVIRKWEQREEQGGSLPATAPEHLRSALTPAPQVLSSEEAAMPTAVLASECKPSAADRALPVVGGEADGVTPLRKAMPSRPLDNTPSVTKPTQRQASAQICSATCSPPKTKSPLDDTQSTAAPEESPSQESQSPAEMDVDYDAAEECADANTPAAVEAKTQEAEQEKRALEKKTQDQAEQTALDAKTKKAETKEVEQQRRILDAQPKEIEKQRPQLAAKAKEPAEHLKSLEANVQSCAEAKPTQAALPVLRRLTRGSSIASSGLGRQVYSRIKLKDEREKRDLQRSVSSTSLQRNPSDASSSSSVKRKPSEVDPASAWRPASEVVPAQSSTPRYCLTLRIAKVKATSDALTEKQESRKEFPDAHEKLKQITATRVSAGNKENQPVRQQAVAMVAQSQPHLAKQSAYEKKDKKRKQKSYSDDESDYEPSPERKRARNQPKKARKGLGFADNVGSAASQAGVTRRLAKQC